MEEMLAYWRVVPLMIAAFGLLVVYWWLHNRLTPYDDYAEMDRGNYAPAIVRSGAYLGLLIAICGSLVLSLRGSVLDDVLMFLIDGAVVIAVFTVATVVFDRFILRGTNNAQEVLKGNVAVALVEFSAYVGLGVILSASFTGEGSSLWQGLASAVVFSFVGMATLMIVYSVHEFLTDRFGRRRPEEAVRGGDLASAIDIGSLLLAMSATLWFAIAGDFTGWTVGLWGYGVAAAVSIIAVSLARLCAQALVSRRSDSANSRIARSVVIGFVSIGIGLLAGLAPVVV